MSTLKKNGAEWEEVGHIGVDAGLCFLGDPCYFDSRGNEGNPFENWLEFCEWLQKEEERQGDYRTFKIPYAKGHEGRGVVVSTGYGDGCYPVYIRKTPEGRVAELKVVFVADGGEEEE